MNHKKFKLTHMDKRLVDLVNTTDKKTLALWAVDCAERVMPYFEDKYPVDKRPRKAIETLQDWIKTGEFKMSVIRSASLSSHAAAREVGEDNPAKSAARAAGQAVATAHVFNHSLGAAIYALQAIYRASEPLVSEKNINKERKWQFDHLTSLIKNSNKSI